MNKQERLLISAATVGAYALVLFTAAGFFFTNYRETMAACSRYSYADCSSNESIYVTLISLKIGTAVFFLMGTFAWMIGSYLAVRWIKVRATYSLP
jgi:hypothetical protein